MAESTRRLGELISIGHAMLRDFHRRRIRRVGERPRHGYEANLELERREIRDWANLSRPQVYYSLEKLARAGLIRPLETDEPAGGPERSTFETTAKGRAALADALEHEGWATQR